MQLRQILLSSRFKPSGIVSFFRRCASALRRLSLVQRFTLISFVIMMLGAAGIGWWIEEQIEAGVIKEATAATALYMDSFIAPNLQELGNTNVISTEHVETLNSLFSQSNLGQRTISIKIWNRDHRIIYSNIPSLVGRVFPNNEEIAASFAGKVTGDISNLADAENIEERRLSSEPLLEVYSPVRLNDTDEVIAVAEFYQKVDTLETEIDAAQRKGWLVLISTMLLIYMLLIGFVQWAGNRIGQQEVELKNQVSQLTALLTRNKELSQHIRLAAANAVALNEKVLRRTSAELHDGPVQEISLALLRLDRALAQSEVCRLASGNTNCGENLPVIQSLLQDTLKELRFIASSLGVPQLEALTLSDVILRAVVLHEQRSGTEVVLNMNAPPPYAPLPIKIAVYRLIQEALSNSHRHGGGVGQEVQIAYDRQHLEIEAIDQGPGFNVEKVVVQDEYLGLAGIRERVESLGGSFLLQSQPGQGTRIFARFALESRE
jgi:signal transduction histidine kinase